jgi:hypothetical protein
MADSTIGVDDVDLGINRLKNCFRGTSRKDLLKSRRALPKFVIFNLSRGPQACAYEQPSLEECSVRTPHPRFLLRTSGSNWHPSKDGSCEL